jgi:hypothetical protein
MKYGVLKLVSFYTFIFGGFSIDDLNLLYSLASPSRNKITNQFSEHLFAFGAPYKFSVYLAPTPS